EKRGTRETRLCGPSQGEVRRISQRRSRPLHSGSPRGSWYRRPLVPQRERMPCGKTRQEGRVPAVVVLEEQVSVREWPASPVLTAPTDVSRAEKRNNYNANFGLQPSGHRIGVSTPCTTTSGGVTSSGRRGSE